MKNDQHEKTMKKYYNQHKRCAAINFVEKI